MNYKLGRFSDAVDLFSGPNSELYDEGEGEQIDDICTNMAACAANEASITDKCQKIFDEFQGQLDSSEYTFNASLISLKQ